MSGFEHVFTPFTFGPVTVKNRIEMAPTGYNMGLFNGEGTEAMVAYYESLAKSGDAHRFRLFQHLPTVLEPGV